ncbi:RDD family protein [Bacillaceae bacterium IKA-2]|nr:RDD family protein [Bacillaceae bacterium IKA-2]
MEKTVDVQLKERFLAPDLRAGGWIRILAMIYDITVLGMFLIMFGGATTLWMLTKTETSFIGDPMRARQDIMANEPHLLIINYIILISVFLFCQIIYPAIKKQTFGMMITDLTLVDEDRKELTFWQYVKRECWKILLFPTFVLSFIKERRPLYDKMSKSYLMKY